MRKIKVFCFITLLFSFISCNKDENTSSIADKVIGTYNGTTYYGTAQLSCTSIITKTADTKVELKIIFNGSNFVFGGIAVYNSGNNTYILSYSEQNGSIDGKVIGKTLTYTVTSGVLTTRFSGTR